MFSITWSEPPHSASFVENFRFTISALTLRTDALKRKEQVKVGEKGKTQVQTNHKTHTYKKSRGCQTLKSKQI